ncbi:tetratricopeptide repeat protein [Parendozoicomonas haliclonae]|uniref:TPR repeat-containing protein YrrB n=1 Tax=Parendozoicomonas haliclonae TaxID=1960125 RepID=A0A1X7ALF2_9GAMM|nr:tetratricopeptide repeat protein [Parendozoicomonas haliclonae]SMA48426.1 TPR repeat-containing protein YrrB [Parendozoicomonas haliclonae]
MSGSATLDAQVQQNTTEQLFHQGTQFLAEGDQAQALMMFDQVCQQQPEFPGAHYNRGICLFQKGDMEQAREAFEQVISLAPEVPAGYLNAGKCALALNNMEQSIAWFSKALELAPAEGNAHLGRGLARFESGDLQQAIEDFAVIPQDHSSFWMAQHYLGVCYLELEKPAEAVEAFNQSDRVSPNRMETMEMLFLALHRNQQFAEAMELYETLVVQDPAIRSRYSEEVRLARKAVRIPLHSLSDS